MKLIILFVFAINSCYSFSNININFVTVSAPVPRKQFGYSLVLGKKTIFVGSPKSNDNGVVYKCNEGTQCEIYLKDDITEPYTNCEVPFKKHLFGSSLVIHNNVLTACAPDWNTCLDKSYAVTGICLQKNMENNVTELLNETSKNKYYSITLPNYVIKYKYGFAVYGTSLYVDENGILVIGTPGAFNNKGTIFVNNTDLLIDFHIGGTESQDSYIGYSVVSGKFNDDGETLYAAGSPRYGLDKSGQVIIINKAGTIVQNLTSDLPFSYFGSSLAIAKINGIDTRLIVSAPTCEKGSGEYGCILIYNYVNNNFFHKKTKFGYQRNGRYGAAISNLGKVNYDEYDDIAVAAPYEDYGNGAVYIYYGNSNEDFQTYQKLTPEYTKFKKGFGFSLSNGYDYDGNGLNDVAVGCTNCDKVYLFLSRKVISLNAAIIPHINYIANEEEFQITFCITTNYNEHKIENVLVKLNYFYNENRIKNPDIYDEIFNIKNGESCKNIKVKLGVVDDRNTKLNLHINYTYTDDCDEADINTLCPIPSLRNKNYISKNLLFIHECGADRKCQFDYDFTSTVEASPFVYGVNKTLTINFEIKNNGPELMPQFHLNLITPHKISLASSEGDICKEDIFGISCDYNKELKPNNHISRKMKIIFENLNVMTKEVNLKVSVSSEEINKSVMLTKEIVKDYNISITTLDNNTFNLRNNGNEYKRLFTIINYGLTKEADARLVFQYNALDYRQVNMKEIFTCNFTASIITCDFKKLDKKEFFIEEIYDYDLAVKSDLEIIESGYNITITAGDVKLFNEVFVFNTQIIKSFTLIVALSSSLVAIILALIIGIILWKCGFFERKKFNKLENDKDMADIPEGSSLEGISEEEDEKEET